MSLKDRIKELCKQKGVTMGKVEADLGFASGYLSKLNTSTPTIPRMQAVADYLGVPLDVLLGTEQGYYLDEETAQVAQEIFENKELRALFSVGRNMSAADLRALHGMALALKRKERYDDDPA